MNNPETDKVIRGIIDPTPVEMEELRRLKDEIYSRSGEKKQLRQEFILKSKFLLSGIPRIYWDIGWNDFRGDAKAKKFTEVYAQNIQEAFTQGQGIIFLGNHGTGKTTLACLIGKMAIEKGFTVRYISVAKILDMIYDSFSSLATKDRLDTMIERVEFLILDDLGKEYKGLKEHLAPMVSLKLDSLLRERMNRVRVTIGTTNYSLKAIMDKYGESVLSVIHGACRIVEVTGADYRMVRGLSFWDNLK